MSSDLEKTFLAAVEYIRGLPPSGSFKPSNAMKLKFYSCFKQATEGKVQGSQPSRFSFTARAKWDAWNALGDMGKDDAMKTYVAELNKLNSEWQKGALSLTAGKRALLIIDVQNDFCEGGSLAVPDANAIVPKINELREKVEFDLVVLSQDFHPKDHVSFASNNEGSTVLTVQKIDGVGEQMMWPDHCVQGTTGCEFNKDLVKKDTDVVVAKGLNKMVDSYSAFWDNDKKEQTEMEKTLKNKEIKDVIVCGLAYEYCAGFTALDAVAAGFKTTFLEDLSRGIKEDDAKAMKEKLEKAGVTVTTSATIV